MLLYAGRAPEAEQELRDLTTKIPDHFKVLAYFGSVLYYEGKVDEAKQILDRSIELAHNSGDVTPQLLSGFLYASLHQREKIDPRLLQFQPGQMIDGDGAYWIGGIYALLGEKRAALDWFKRTVALGNTNYPWFERDKNYDSLRSDPEYQKIMAGVRQRWEANKSEFDAPR
jgi:tetratricopeptide (TPR) repeat protein